MSIRRLIEKERAAERFISIFSFCAMTCLVSINVFARYILHKSFIFTEELSYIFFNWYVMIGVCNIFRNRGLVALDVFVNALPQSAGRVVNILVDFVLIGTNIVLAYLSIELSVTGVTRKTPYFALPYTIMYIPAVIAFATMAVSSCGMLYRDITGKKEEMV